MSDEDMQFACTGCPPAPICMYCARLHPLDARNPGMFCDAFPDGAGIPRPIIYTDVDHRTDAVLGDHGLRFVPTSAQAAADAARIIGDARALDRASLRSRLRIVK